MSVKNGQIYTPEGRAYKRKGKYWFVHWTADHDWTDVHIPAAEITEDDWNELMRNFGGPKNQDCQSS